MRNKLTSKAFKASLLKNKKEANGKAFQKVFIVRSLAPRNLNGPSLSKPGLKRKFPYHCSSFLDLTQAAQHNCEKYEQNFKVQLAYFNRVESVPTATVNYFRNFHSEIFQAKHDMFSRKLGFVDGGNKQLKSFKIRTSINMP